MKKVGIVMGSDSDLPVIEKAVTILKELCIPYEVHIYSAHRRQNPGAELFREIRYTKENLQRLGFFLYSHRRKKERKRAFKKQNVLSRHL